ncbi:MAG TPA: choice-of-anchor Q domain-containing protein [Pyrinomonadaceae bacterium]|jgi:Tol biopolymer transport system component
MRKPVVIVGTITFILCLMIAEAQAVTRTVTTKTDNVAGSLRQAITSASNGDKIIFQTGLSGSILLTSPIILTKNLTIEGPGANILSVEGRSSPTEVRVFEQSAGNMLISGLRIANGFSSGAGGGILVDGGNMTLNNCLLSGNSAESGGGILVFTGSSLTITNSTISGNESFVEGGGVSNRGGTLVLTNSTISGNIAPLGGVSVDNGGTATILNCTISGNGESSPSAGDIGGLRIAAGSTVNIKNTIIAVNTGSPNDVGGAVNSQGNNLIGNTTGGTGFVISDLQNVNPQLGVLTNNGGTTQTQALLAGSPATDAGNNSGAPATDQRGGARPQGATADIGAYESGVNFPVFGKIVFVRNTGGNNEIFTMNADGSNQTQLTGNFADDSAPKWSADGSKIVFQSNRDGNNEIYTMNADGSSPVRLTNNALQDNFPDWSPDASKIVFVKGTSYPAEIWVMDADGGNQTQLSGNTLFGETQPSWSPDGFRIAFSASPTNGGTWELYTMNANGTSRNRLTTNTTTDSYPVWSPDGNALAFTNDLNGTHAYLMNLSDSSVRIVADINDPNETAPAWSPDGTKLAQYNAAGSIYFTNIGGGTLQSALIPEGLSISPLLDWFGVNTPTGANVTAVLGTVSTTFSSVATGGTTTAVPIDPASAGTLPGGYSFGTGLPAYEITTTAVYSAPITVCLQVPGVTNLTTFNALTLFHNDGSGLMNVTTSRDFATKTICGVVNSLSPFAVAQNLAPTAANVSVSGQVLTSNGGGISRAKVSITDQNGETRWATTNSFGFYRFDEIPAAENYIIGAQHKRYQFSSRVIAVSDNIQNADFTAEPE